MLLQGVVQLGDFQLDTTDMVKVGVWLTDCIYYFSAAVCLQPRQGWKAGWCTWTL